MDVGTGSGAIALALASEGQFEQRHRAPTSRSTRSRSRAPTSRAARRCSERRWSSAHGSLLGAGARASAARRGLESAVHCVRTSARRCPRACATGSRGGAVQRRRRAWRRPRGSCARRRRCSKPGGLLALEVDARRASLVAELVATDGAYEQVQVRAGSHRPRAIRGRQTTGGGMIEERQGARAADRTEPRVPGGEARQRRARARIATAVALLQQMEQLRIDAQQMIQRGERPTEEMEQQLDDAARPGAGPDRRTSGSCRRRRTSTSSWRA